MTRPGMLVGVWLVGVVTATGVAWGAARVVGEQVADRSTAPLTARVVDGLVARTPTPTGAPSAVSPSPGRSARPASRAATGSRPRSPSATVGRPTTPPARSPQPHHSTPPATPRATSRTATFSSVGGVVAVSCTVSTAALRYASPAAGFTSEVENGGPQEVEVRFRSSGHESRIRVECVNGSPSGRVEERDGSSGKS